MGEVRDFRVEGQTGSSAGGRVTVERLEAWLKEAQPGARLVYFTGVTAAEGSKPLNERLMAEAQRGMIYLFQQRRPMDSNKGAGTQRTGFDYLAVRSSRPAIDGRPRRPLGLSEQAEALFKRGRRA